MTKKDEPVLSIVFPCRNEAATVGICIDEARRYVTDNGIDAEIIVCDNASDDGSDKVAADHGARVIRQERIGYGYTLRAGMAAASGSVILIADCDTTYDISEIRAFMSKLDEGYDMVIGDRFKGCIEDGAMPFSHRIGVKALSALARAKIGTDVHDFHCGIRAIRKDALDRLEFHTGGMEFATEMIAVAVRSGLLIAQIPANLRRCTIMRRSKLRTIRDGMRHLLYIIRF